MLSITRFWILISAVLVGAGWILSAMHQLNRAGYILVLLPLLVFVLFKWREADGFSWANFEKARRKYLKRFSRRLPLLFLIIAGLSFLGGCLYLPLNYDANAYRIPRVLHWLWEGHWHVIRAQEIRMNISACGMEWMLAPLILFTHSDRLLFLLNWIPFIMLPGLIFSLFVELQVRPRVAWWWSWLLASGWCYSLQSGSAANDGFATVYVLAAICLALRARRCNCVTDLWLSLLAAGLATGVKQTNLPLAPLWLVVAWPARELLWQHKWSTAVVGVFGVLVSVVPISVLNYCHYGSWLPLELPGVTQIGHFQMSPLWGILGNAFCIPVQNLVPPFYGVLPPFYSSWPVLWNEEMRHFLVTPFGAHFRCFENFGNLAEGFSHGFTEGAAGIGLGICIVIFSTMYELRRLRVGGLGDSPKSLNFVAVRDFVFARGGADGKSVKRAVASDVTLWLLRILPWGALLLFMAKDGAFESARHLAPYYVLLFPVWLVQPNHARVVRLKTWQNLGAQIMVLTIIVLIALSERPLFPAVTFYKALRARFPNSEFLSDKYVHYLESGFQNMAARRNYLRHAIPPGEQVVGFYYKYLSADEPSVWLPYGQRRVQIVLPEDSAAYLRSQGIHYLVVDGKVIPSREGGAEKWLNDYNASIVDKFVFETPTMATFGSVGKSELYIIRLNQP